MFSVRKSLARFGLYLTAVDKESSELWGRIRPTLTDLELMRVGTPDGDGGYLVPDDFEGLVACLSAGIADNCDFELDFASLTSQPVLMLDPSIDAPPVSHPLFQFASKFLAKSSSANSVSLDDWVSEAPKIGDCLLSMDIEGAEFEVIEATDEDALRRFRIMVFEVHSLEELAHPLGNARFSRFLDKITKNHTIIHAHANNVGGEWRFPGWKVPAGVELTLIRNDRISTEFGFAEVPHPLDRDCVVGLKKIGLEFPRGNRNPSLPR